LNPKLLDALECWRDWMGAENAKLGFPVKSLAMEGGSGAWGNYAEEAQQQQDVLTAKAVDAVISGIEADNRLAVHVIQLGARWPYDSPSKLENDYSMACQQIEIGLRRRNILI